MPTAWNGVRGNVEPWRRRTKGNEIPEKQTHNNALVESIEWMHVRRGREWTVSDAELLAELHARCFGFHDVQKLRMWSVPSWVSRDLVPRRRMAGNQRFLAILIHIFRQGSVGALLSYEECMALCDVDARTTWREWCKEWERLGLVRIVQTWTEDEDHERRRRHGRLLYRIGPALEDAAGFGICENAPGLDSKRAEWAGRAAMGARAKARRARNERRSELYETTRPESAQKAEAAPLPTGGNDDPPAEAPAVVESDADEGRPVAAPVQALTDSEQTSDDRPAAEGERPARQVRIVPQQAQRKRVNPADMAPSERWRLPGSPSKSGPETPLAANIGVAYSDHPPPPSGSVAPGPEDPPTGSLRSPEGSRSARASLSHASATVPEDPPRPATAPVGGGALDGVNAGTGARGGRRRSLADLWATIEASPHSDPALRAAVRRAREDGNT